MHAVITRLEGVVVIVMLLCMQSTYALILPVPEEFETIQVALDSSNEGDTVLVAPGVYHEFLVSPNHIFVLSGWYPADTVSELRSLLDPIPSVGIDTPSVFTIVSDTALITNFAFFNRTEIRQTNGTTRAGAIENGAGYLRIDNCRFDSVSAAIRGGNDIRISECDFVGCFDACLQPSLSGRVIAQNCAFESGAYAMAFAYDGSRFEDCSFSCNTTAGHFLDISGSNINVSRCKFGPCVGAFWVMNIYPVSNVVIEDCLFEGLDRVYSILGVGIICDSVQGIPIVIRNNRFRDNHQGVIAIDLQCAQQSAGFLGLVEHNTFSDGDAVNSLTPGVHLLRSTVQIWNNTFEDLGPDHLADVLVEGFPNDTILARNNSFLPPGLAVRQTNPHFDARENWWGDSTGPYNASVNPEGQGSEVGNGVLFTPWLTQHPDSIDSTEVAMENPNVLLPSAYSLTAFPNPFNATTTLSVEVAHAGNYDVILYDVTGREAAKLYAGTIESQKSVRVNAERFASGVYFAELRSDEGVLATTKLLLLK